MFETVEPLFNLCYTHRIVSKHLLNLTNRFALRITKLLTKFDSIPLLNTFSHFVRMGNPTKTLCSTSLTDLRKQLTRWMAVTKFTHAHEGVILYCVQCRQAI